MDSAASADHSMLQCASYVLEMLSHGGLRSHVMSALVTDDSIQLLIYAVPSIHPSPNFPDHLGVFSRMAEPT